MTWNILKEKNPVLYQLCAVEDHEGNKSLGVFLQQRFAVFKGMPPIGFVIKWRSIFTDLDGFLYYSDGSPVNMLDFFELQDDE